MTSDQMLQDSKLIQAGIDKPANGSQPETPFLDTKIQFEAWMDEVKPIAAQQLDLAPPDFIVECDSVSRCEIQFEGILQLTGFLDGQISAPGGTLITGPGIVNANIEVGTAIIGSFGNVNISATDRVVLRGKVCVAGNIRATSLSIREGAIFDGDCSFREDQKRDLVAPVIRASETVPATLGAGAAAD